MLKKEGKSESELPKRKEPPTKRESRHHGGASRGKLGRGKQCEAGKEIESLPDSISDVTKRGSNWPAAPPPVVNWIEGAERSRGKEPPTKRESRHHGGASRGKLGRGKQCEAGKEIESLPDLISDVTKRGSNWPAAPPLRLLRFGGDWSIMCGV